MLTLRTEHLSKRFGNIQAVSDLNLVVEEGKIFGFLGPNGSGKTTTIGMVLGLITPSGGRIELFGKDTKTHLKFLLSQVGSVLEGNSFYPYLSGRDNLKLFARILNHKADSRVEEVLEMVKLTSRAGDKYGTYSQGMKQRLGIACALLSDPSFLILDEPTNGLDPRGMREIRELILDLGKRGKTILLSSHLLHEVEQVCDHIAIIREGTLVAQGGTAELIKDKNLESFFLEVTEEEEE
jgi:ABC-2 type transport system ATP-binding protein